MPLILLCGAVLGGLARLLIKRNSHQFIAMYSQALRLQLIIHIKGGTPIWLLIKWLSRYVDTVIGTEVFYLISVIFYITHWNCCLSSFVFAGITHKLHQERKRRAVIQYLKTCAFIYRYPMAYLYVIIALYYWTLLYFRCCGFCIDFNLPEGATFLMLLIKSDRTRYYKNGLYHSLPSSVSKGVTKSFWPR